jgi:hypothetical protein
MKRAISIILITLIITLSFGFILTAQEEESEEIFIVETSLKIYDQPRRFSKIFILETGTIMSIDPFFESDSFLKVIIEEGDVEEGYVMIDDLYSNNVSSTTSADLSSGEGSTASARGSIGQKRTISLGSLDFKQFGDVSNVNKMEQRSANISNEIWEGFRLIGLLGEFFASFLTF